jgi:general secretion pathway protein N
MIRKPWFLPVLGIVAYLIFALATLPAGVVLGRLQDSGIRAVGVQGTVWRGQAAAIQIGNMPVGSVSWQLHPFSLLAARVNGSAKVTRPDGFAETSFSLRTGGVTRLTDLSASVPVGSLGISMLPTGWTGMLNARMTDLALTHGWPSDAHGTLEVRDLNGPSSKMGSYKATFPAEGAQDANVLAGNVVDLGGPLRVAGTLKISPNRSYVLEGLVATQPDAPPDITRNLQYLGAADAQGRRQFSLAGSM